MREGSVDKWQSHTISWVYAGKNNGNVWNILDNLNNLRTQNFDYDMLNRIKSAATVATSGLDAWTQSFLPDAWGNLSQDGSWRFAPGFDSNNHMSGSTVLPTQCDHSSVTWCYDQAGDLIWDLSHAYEYDAESRVRSVNGGGTATYVYDTEGQRAQKTVGQDVTDYVHFGGQIIAEHKANGDWSDYIYAGSQRVARADTYEDRLYLQGTRCSDCGWQYAVFTFPNAAGYSGYIIRPGDQLLLHQWQQLGTHGGMMLGFSDGSNSNWVTPDQDGVQLNDDSSQNAWHFRRVDLAPHVNKALVGISLLAENDTAPGNWQLDFNEIVIVSADGTVRPIYVRQTGVSLTVDASSGMSGVGYGIGHDASLPNAQNPINTTTYYHSDHLGSSRVLSSTFGYPVWQATYLPFGIEWNPQSTVNNYKFTGKERDTETGLDNFGARMYGSTMGRFLSPDDVRNDSNVADPQSWNLYAYVRNNPLRYTDPDGKEATVTTQCSSDGKTCQVNVSATVAIYAVNGTSNAQLQQAQAAITEQVQNAWNGSFAQDGVTYNVSTTVNVSIVGSEEAAFKSGAQNAIGIDASGNAQNHLDAGPRGSGQDRGVWDFSSITSGQLAPHEFSHVVGLDDNHGNNLSNAFSPASMGRQPHATSQDLQWALGPELHQRQMRFNVGQREGRDWLNRNRGNRHWWEVVVKQKDNE